MVYDAINSPARLGIYPYVRPRGTPRLIANWGQRR